MPSSRCFCPDRPTVRSCLLTLAIRIKLNSRLKGKKISTSPRKRDVHPSGPAGRLWTPHQLLQLYNYNSSFIPQDRLDEFYRRGGVGGGWKGGAVVRVSSLYTAPIVCTPEEGGGGCDVAVTVNFFHQLWHYVTVSHLLCIGPASFAGLVSVAQQPNPE